jgi:hypothetical protein
MKWLPMRLAPKDGTIIIVTGKMGSPLEDPVPIALAKYWKIGRSGGWSMNNGYSWSFTCGCRPTHWMKWPGEPKTKDKPSQK